MAQTQMNIRIDERLKALGDGAFEAIGWTPSQAARALWRFAAEHEGNPRALKEECEKLASGDGRPDTGARSLVEGSWAIVGRGLEACGIDAEAPAPGEDYDSLRERSLNERLFERGLL